MPSTIVRSYRTAATQGGLDALGSLTRSSLGSFVVSGANESASASMCSSTAIETIEVHPIRLCSCVHGCWIRRFSIYWLERHSALLVGH